MGDVEIPIWLKGLPLAPEYHPTDTEFADPIAYISKIEKEASAFGICKVIPPLPKPSRKYVLSNLNKSLSRSPELGSDASSSGICSSSQMGGNKGNDREVRAVFTTRHQELGQNMKRNKGSSQVLQSAAHKQVWQSGEVYTLDQFEAKSKAFARSRLGTISEVSPLVIEALFWKATSEKPIYVEYANDVPGSGFGEVEEPFNYFHKGRRKRKFDNKSRGSPNFDKQEMDIVKNSHKDSEKDVSIKNGLNPSLESFDPSSSSSTLLSDEYSRSSRQKSPNTNNDREGTAGWKLSNSPWNLQVIARSPGSLTRFMPDEVPGVTSPMVYIGMLFSWFAWHVEDHELHSLNFLHIGSPKTWYAVPGDHAFAFEEVIRTRGFGGNLDRLAALTLLGEKTTLLSPEVVVASGIPCCRLVQNPGEFVVTFPRAYHVGFGHGFNCGEAANFGTPQWLKVAKEAAVRRAAMNYLPMLSHQQLLYLLTMSFISRVPRALLPGARSSRLRDRQKEERELLVKKAFIDDMLNENNLLSVLGKESTFYAVLWDPESLPSPCKDSESVSLSTSPDAPGLLVDERSTEICNSEKNTSYLENVLQDKTTNAASMSSGEMFSFNFKNENSCNNLVNETRLHMETANLYVDDDLPCGLHVDSGTLACVACGILGFPFMSVVQPSERALKELFPADKLVQEGPGVLNSVKHCASSRRDDTGKGSSSDAQEDQDKNEKEKLSLTCKGHVPLTESPRSGRVMKKGTDAITSLSEAAESAEFNPHNNLTGALSNAKLNPSMHPYTHDLPVPCLSQVPEETQMPLTGKVDKKWNTSNGFLRPRVFCLEHTAEIKELLQSKGGANVLIICHSDYLKIKAHAVAIAEEIGAPFNFKDIPLERAPQEDLNLINISIDDEERGECGEDWTSKLGLNLRYCVKLRKMSPSNRGQHALTLGGLFSDINPDSDIVSLKWHCRRSRTHHKTTGPSKFKLCGNTPIKKNDMMVGQSDGSKVVSENKIIQYSRRKFNGNLGGPAGSSRSSGHPREHVPKEVATTNDGNLDGNSTKTSEDLSSGVGKEGNDPVELDIFPTIENSYMLHEILKIEGTSEMREVPDSAESSGSLAIDVPMVGSSEAQIEKNIIVETTMTGEACNLVTLDSSEMQHEIEFADETSKMSKISDCFSQTSKVCDSAKSLGSLTISFLTDRSSKAKLEKRSTEEASTSDKSCIHVTLDRSEMQHDNCATNGTNKDLEVDACANSKGVPLIPVSVLEGSKLSHEIQTEKEPNMGVTAHSSQNSVEVEDVDIILDSKPSKYQGNKRPREVEQVIEDQNNYNSFIKSPCEGLRPRTGRVVACGTGPGTKRTADKKAVMKKVRRQPDVSVASKENKDKAEGAHNCDLEGCRMSFKTRADLLIHKRNRCPHNGCGKRFRSHKYAMLHQRVHAEERPLKCPWKGCKMSFKWAWARTEHLRVHTGERPYQCKVAGCGLTFRFVSDFSRHRRKTGHYVSLPT